MSCAVSLSCFKFQHVTSVTYYHLQTKFAKVMFLRLSVILFTGGTRTRGTLPRTRGRSPHHDQRQVPPPRTRCMYPSPGPEAGTPLPHQVHPLDQRQIPPPTRYTPTSLAGTPPSPTSRYIPPPWQVHPPPPLAGTPPYSACWEIRARSGRYALY